MEIFYKKSLSLKETTYKKKEIALREANGISAIANELGNQVKSGDDVTLNTNGQVPTNTIKATVPVLKNASPTQAANAIQNTAKTVGKNLPKNAQIDANVVEVDPTTDADTKSTIEKSYNPGSSSQLTNESVSFTKREMNRFLKNL